MSRLKKARFLFVYPLAIAIAATAHTTERQLGIGIALAIVGMLVRVWANGYVGHVKVNQTQRARGDAPIGRLVTAGPYAFVRNPLYVGSVFIGAGICVIAGNPWLSLIGLVCFIAVYRRKTAQEEALLLREVGPPYQLYADAVPRWWPTWRRYADAQGRWTWHGVEASREWKTVMWTTAILLLLYLREEAIQEHELFAPGDWYKHAAAIAVVLAMVLFEATLRIARARCAASS